MLILKNILHFFFSEKNEGCWKIRRICGIKFRKFRPEYAFKTLADSLYKKIIHTNQRLITAAITNKDAFASFRGCNRGKNVVLVAAGPSVKYFNKIPGAVYVGCNRAFLLDMVAFDYLFAIDKVGIEKYYESFFNYRLEECIKFIGDQNLGKDYQIPEMVIPRHKNIYRYITDANIENKCSLYSLDISTAPLHNSASVSIQAMQFILWTQPEAVYIVGVDCTCASAQHFIGESAACCFRNEDLNYVDSVVINSYRQIKVFAQTYYPQIRIFSINPVGLKNIFTDIYTAENPGIKI